MEKKTTEYNKKHVHTQSVAWRSRPQSTIRSMSIHRVWLGEEDPGAQAETCPYTECGLEKQTPVHNQKHVHTQCVAWRSRPWSTIRSMSIHRVWLGEEDPGAQSEACPYTECGLEKQTPEHNQKHVHTQRQHVKPLG